MLLCCAACKEVVTPAIWRNSVIALDPEPNALGRIVLIGEYLRIRPDGEPRSSRFYISESDARGFVHFTEHAETCVAVDRSARPTDAKTRPGFPRGVKGGER